MSQIRFHTDEHIGRAVVEGLRRRGIEVSTALDEGLQSATDEQQLHHAHNTGRVFVTQDRDFLRLHAEGARHSGIAFFLRDELLAKSSECLSSCTML